MELRRAKIHPELTIIKSKRRKNPASYRGPDSPLYSAICPFVYIFRIFGVAPYEFVDDILVPSWTYAIFSFVWLIIYSYLINELLNSFYHVNEESFILSHTETAKTVFNYSVTVMNILVSLWSRGEFTEIWSKIQDFDERLREMGYARNERKTSIFVWSTLFISFIMWTLISRLGIYAFDQSWWDNVSYLIIYVGSAISVVKFSSMLLILGDRFDQLNKIAMTNIPDKSRWINVICVVDVKTIERLHDSLMVTGETLASRYSWPLMAWVCNLSFHIVFNLYIIILRIMNFDFILSIILCLTAWTIGFAQQLILVHYACHYAARKANMMGYIIFSWKRWLYTRNQHLIVETSLHLKNRKLIFSGGGCFDINLYLLRSIAAIMTTYLVILLQLD